MSPQLTSLPDEVLGLIAKHLSRSALLQISLVCKRFRDLVLPQLFAKLDLADRTASEVEDLYRDLFEKRRTGEVRGPLAAQQLRMMSYCFIETCLDEDEFQAKAKAVHRIIGDLQAIHTLEVEFSISDETMEVFESILQPAIKEFFMSIENKARSLEIRLDMDASDDLMDEDTQLDLLTKKVQSVAELIPSHRVSSLCLVGVAVRSLPLDLIQILQSPSLKKLTLQECNSAFNGMPAVRQLEELTLSWGGQEEEGIALAAVSMICSNSAPVLKSLTIQAALVHGQTLPKGFLASMAMPQLTRLRLSDWHLGSDSLFDTVLSHVTIPNLKSLILETEDILAGAAHVTSKLNRLPSLQDISFMERRANSDDNSNMPEPVPFEVLREVCKARRITIECTVTSHCDTAGKLKHEFDRLKILAGNLTGLSLQLQLPSLETVDRVSRQFPFVRILSVTLSDAFSLTPSRTEGDGSLQDSQLKAFLTSLICPSLKILQTTFLINGPAALSLYRQLEDVLKSPAYPLLEHLTGAIMAGPDMSPGDLDDLEAAIKAACLARKIDISGMQFIQHDEYAYIQSEGEDDAFSDEEDVENAGDEEHHTGDGDEAKA